MPARRRKQRSVDWLAKIQIGAKKMRTVPCGLGKRRSNRAQSEVGGSGDAGGDRVGGSAAAPLGRVCRSDPDLNLGRLSSDDDREVRPIRWRQFDESASITEPLSMCIVDYVNKTQSLSVSKQSRRMSKRSKGIAIGEC